MKMYDRIMTGIVILGIIVVGASIGIVVTLVLTGIKGALE